MTRTVSSPTQAAAGAGVSQPLYLVEIDWSTAVYLCTHSTQTWGGQTWLSADVRMSFDSKGMPTSIDLSDPTDAYRTLLLTEGVTNKRVAVWKAYIGALAISDPVSIFDGYGDGGTARNGRMSFNVGRAQTGRQFSPRQRIGPAIGVNFVAVPKTKVVWSGQTIVLEPR